VIGLILLLVLIIFLLSNRGPALVGFWPFGFLGALPLGAVVLAALVLGFLGGLAAHLPKRLGAHRRARRAEKRAAELEARLAAEIEARRIATLPAPALISSGGQPTLIS
jgi:uncharacterized integral membrane protein